MSNRTYITGVLELKYGELATGNLFSDCLEQAGLSNWGQAFRNVSSSWAVSVQDGSQTSPGERKTWYVVTVNGQIEDVTVGDVAIRWRRFLDLVNKSLPGAVIYIRALKISDREPETLKDSTSIGDEDAD